MTKAFHWMKQNPYLVLLFVVGALVRIVYAGGIPPGLNQDEASIGYDAYSILHYGIDRNGVTLPIHLIAWGSGQNALYAYLSLPFIYLFGLNVFSIRAVSMVFGLLSMVLVYLIANQLFKRKHAATAAAFFIVICPWHIMMSRWALESNLFPSFVLLAVFFLFKAIQQPKWLIGFTITISASLYAYGTAYFFVPVFVLGLAILFAVKRTFRLRMLLWNMAVMVAASLPVLFFVLINKYDWPAFRSFLFTIPKLTVPRVEQVSSAFQGNALSGFAQHFKQFLSLYATQNDGLIWNTIPAYGYLYPIALPLICIGICYTVYKLAKHFSVENAIIAIWFVTAVLMALITDVNINRINIIFYPTILLAVSGLLWLRKEVKGSFIIVIAVFSIFFVSFCSNYFTDYPKKISSIFFESFGEALQYASSETDGNIYVTNKVNMPYIFVLFYEQINPHDFISTVKYANPGAQFQQVQSFGRYYFEDTQMRQGENAAYIFSNGDALPAENSGYTIKRFKHYTVVSGDGTAAAPEVHGELQNGGFEEGQQYWSFTPGTGVATNRPSSGASLLYLDPGQERNVTQTFVSSGAGEYVLSAQVSASAEGGRVSVMVNGVVQQKMNIAAEESYYELQLPAVQAAVNDTVSISFTGGSGWINVDDVLWKASE